MSNLAIINALVVAFLVTVVFHFSPIGIIVGVLTGFISIFIVDSLLCRDEEADRVSIKNKAEEKIENEILSDETEQAIILYFLLYTTCIGSKNGIIDESKEKIFNAILDSLKFDDEYMETLPNYVAKLFEKHKVDSKLPLLNERIEVAKTYSKETHRLIIRGCEIIAGKSQDVGIGGTRGMGEEESKFIERLRNEWGLLDTNTETSTAS